MINILIPMAGNNQFFSEAEYPFPKPLIEINDKMMIEHVVDNFSTIEEEIQFIFVVNSYDCKKYHLDNIFNILTNHSCKIIRLDNITKGAACSAMMAVEYIDNAIPLIIANSDQLFDLDLNDVINSFEKGEAGVITFESIHPRWSYVRLNEKNEVVEAAEKRPISRNAIAGLYYFKKGSDFVSSASKMIKKDANIEGLYYIAPSLNEMVLDNKKINVYKAENSKYHTFYTPQKIKEYERLSSC